MRARPAAPAGAEPDDEDEEPGEAAPEEAPAGLFADPAIVENLREAERILEAVLVEPLPGRELVLRYRDVAAGRPNGEALIHLFARVATRLSHQRAILKKHGLYCWIPEEARDAPEEPHHGKRKASAPKIGDGFLWPPPSAPVGVPLDAGEGQVRCWLRCAQPGCHRRGETIIFVTGLSAAEQRALVEQEAASAWRCFACAARFAEQLRVQARRSEVAAALRAVEKPLPSPSVVCTLLRQGTLEGDDRARDQLRIHRDSLDAATFHRMMGLVFVELEQLAPKTKSPAKLAQHRARIGAFRIFAGGPVFPGMSPRRPAVSPRPPERRSP